MNERILNQEQILSYACWLRAEERAAGTVAKYLRDVRRFAAWLEGRPVTKERLTEWKAYLQAEQYNSSTINGALAALNGLFRFLGWKDCWAKYLKVQRRMFRDSSRDLTRGDYDRLISAARERGQHRLMLLMETICATGIRVSEVKYITVEAAQDGRADISLKGKIRTILLPAKLCRKLLKYAKKQKTVSGEIFLTRNGTPINRSQIWAEMKALCQSAGVEPAKVFPHNLRHLFATAFYRASRDIVHLADVLGHSSIETTRIYLLTSGAEHQKQLDQLGFVS